MQFVVLSVLVCAVAAQYYQNQVPTPNQAAPTRFSQYSNNQYGQQYGQPSYSSNNGYATSSYGNNMNSQYGTTPGYNNNRMYDSQTQRYYNGVSSTSAVMAVTAAAVALIL